MRKTRLFIVLMVCLLALPLAAQTNGRITMTFKNEGLSSVFKRLEKTTDYKFIFAYEDVEKYKVNGQVSNQDIHGVLRYVLDGKPLGYTIKGNIVNVQKTDSKGEFYKYKSPATD